MNVKILADSASDLTDTYYEQYDIDRASLTVHLHGKEYKDGAEITPKTVYDAMKEGADTKTCQVSSQTIQTIFTTYMAKEQPLVYLAFSSKLSGTYLTKKIVEQKIKEEHPESPIHVVDLKCASLGYGLAVIRAAKLAQEGATSKEIIDMALYHAQHMEHILAIDVL